MQIEEYSPEKLNLTEFIQLYDIQLILNNELIQKSYFEVYNHEDLYNNLLEEVTANPEEYIDTEIYDDPEELQEAITDYVLENIPGEIYQYYIISENQVHYLIKYLPDYPILYSDELDIYLLGVGHCGMSWSFFFTEAPRPGHMKHKKYDELLGAATNEL